MLAASPESLGGRWKGESAMKNSLKMKVLSAAVTASALTAGLALAGRERGVGRGAPSSHPIGRGCLLC